MSTELTVAVIAAVVSVASAVIAVSGQLRVAHLQAEAAERRQRSDKEDEARRVLDRFREPLSRAAADLQSRIYNMVSLDILDRFYVRGSPRERDYVVQSTLYVFAEYLGWTEIIRREVIFLDLGDVEDRRRLAEMQFQISEWLLRSDLPPPFRLFRGEQRAIGEVMIDPSTDPAHCLGPAAFSQRTEPWFRRWLETLESDIEWLANEPDRRCERLVGVQRALIDLIHFLDPEGRRFPEVACKKLPEIEPAAVVPTAR